MSYKTAGPHFRACATIRLMTNPRRNGSLHSAAVVFGHPEKHTKSFSIQMNREFVKGMFSDVWIFHDFR